MRFFFPRLAAELGHRERSPVTQPSEPPPASLATLGRAPRLGTVGTEHSVLGMSQSGGCWTLPLVTELPLLTALRPAGVRATRLQEGHRSRVGAMA